MVKDYAGGYKKGSGGVTLRWAVGLEIGVAQEWKGQGRENGNSFIFILFRNFRLPNK